MNKKVVLQNISIIIFFAVSIMPLMGNATTYWVSVSGEDDNICAESKPCASIQKVANLLQPGDILNITAGTYRNLRGTYPDGQLANYYESQSGIVLTQSGTPDDPIIIQAAPGDKGKVILDFEYKGMGIYLSNQQPYAWPDYFTLKDLVLKRCDVSCILSADNPNGKADDSNSLVTRGVVIEGNQLLECRHLGVGYNSGTLRMDSSRDWTVRDNLIEGCRHATDGFKDSIEEEHGTLAYYGNSGAIYAYNVYDSLIEHNEIRDSYSAIYWKDTANNPPRYPNVQSTIRYNKIVNAHVGIHINAGAGGDTAGYNIISNNIFEDIYAALSIVGEQQEARTNFKHNFINFKAFGPSVEHSLGIGFGPSDPALAADNKSIEVTGNIFVGANQYSFTLNANNRVDVLDFDYNVYAENLKASTSTENYNSLASWRNTTNSIIIDANPGEHSSENIPINTLAINVEAGNYKPPSNSPLLGFMSNGDNAGPYQKGNEVIGLLLTNGAPIGPTIASPLPPSNLGINILPF